jgi:hypothetical protein
MTSKNQLLVPGGVVVEKALPTKAVNEELGWPKRLYHKDFPAGKVLQTLPEQNEYKEDGWVESPADISKPVEEMFKSLDKKSKIDLSVEKKKE